MAEKWKMHLTLDEADFRRLLAGQAVGKQSRRTSYDLEIRLDEIGWDAILRAIEHGNRERAKE